MEPAIVTSSPHFVKKKLATGMVWYVYAWRGGPQILKSDSPKQPKLGPSEWRKIVEAVDTIRAPSSDQVGGALTAFRRSSYWNELASTTKKTWGYALDRIERQWGEAPIAVFSDIRMKPKIVAWRNSMSSTPRTADISVSVLYRWLEWAILEGLVIHNPANGIPTINRPDSRAPVIWLSEDIEAINVVAKQSLRDAVGLAALTGMRRADLVALRWDEVDDFMINRLAAKRSRGKRYTVEIPRLPKLNDLLESLRGRPRKAGVDTVLVNSRGRSWTGDGLDSSFHDARKRANGRTGIWHVERDPITGKEKSVKKRLHDFRGTFATYLMTHPTANLNNKEIANLMGWSPEQVDQIRKRYVDNSAIVVSIGRRLAGGL
jgi:integrase